MINRKLNTTPLLPSEVLPGCEFRMGIETYVVTGIEGELYTCERLQRSFKDDSEEYEVKVVPLSRLQPIDLWDYNNCLTDFRIKSLDFIAEPLGVYYKDVGRYLVTVKDCFYLDECALLTIESAYYNGHNGSLQKNKIDLKVWYFHELQKAIYDITGRMLYTPMGKRLMLTKRALQ